MEGVSISGAEGLSMQRDVAICSHYASELFILHGRPTCLPSTQFLTPSSRWEFLGVMQHKINPEMMRFLATLEHLKQCYFTMMSDEISYLVQITKN